MRLTAIVVALPSMVSAVYSIQPVDLAPTALSRKSLTCAAPESPCGPTTCYNPQTHQCCPNSTNICPSSHNCVHIPTPNGTIAHGCCSSGTACGSQCIDTTVSKCCAVPGGSFGSCPAGSDCCGDMCCDAGKVCARGSEGHQCWPVAGSGVASPTVKMGQDGGEQAQVLRTVPAVKMATIVPGSADPDRCRKGKRATSIPGPADPNRCRNAGSRPAVSVWLFVLLLLTPLVAAVSGADLLNHDTEVEKVKQVRRRALMPVVTAEDKAPTTTLISVSTEATSIGPDERFRTSYEADREEITLPGLGPHKSGGAKFGVSRWLYVLLLLAPFATAMSTFGREERDSEMVNNHGLQEREDHAMPATEESPSTTTLMTAISTAVIHTVEEDDDGGDKKGGGRGGSGHGGGSHGGSTRPGAGAGGAHGAGSRTIDLSTMWPLMMLALPPMLAPLASANIAMAEVVNVNDGRSKPLPQDAGPEQIATPIAAVPSDPMSHEIEDWQTDKKGIRLGGGAGIGALRSAGSRAMSLNTLWPLLFLTLPPLLAPLALANVALAEVGHVNGGRPDPVVNPVEPVTTSLITAVQSSMIQPGTTQHEVEDWQIDKKKIPKHGGGHSAGSRTIDLSTMWPLALLALPQMLAPIVLANVAMAGLVDIDSGRPDPVVDDAAPETLTTSLTTVSTAVIQHQETQDVVKRPGPYGNSAGSGPVDLRTIWPLALLTFPPMLAPLALANLVAGGLINTEGESMKPDPERKLIPEPTGGTSSGYRSWRVKLDVAGEVILCFVVVLFIASCFLILGIWCQRRYGAG